MTSGVYVLGGMCLWGKCPGGKYPWGKCLGGTCPGGVLSCHCEKEVMLWSEGSTFAN